MLPSALLEHARGEVMREPPSSTAGSRKRKRPAIAGADAGVELEAETEVGLEAGGASCVDSAHISFLRGTLEERLGILERISQKKQCGAHDNDRRCREANVEIFVEGQRRILHAALARLRQLAAS